MHCTTRPRHTPPLHSIAASLATIAATFAATLALVPAVLPAQRAGNAVETSAGAFWMARRDDTISPVRYSGSGWQGAVAWTRTSGAPGGRALRMAFDGGMATLSPDVLPSSQRVWRGNADLSLTAPLPAHAMHAVRGGVALRGSMLVTRQHFHAASVAVPTYRFSSITIAPTVGTTGRVMRGETRVHVALPLAGIVDRPYSAVKSGATRLDATPVSATTFRGVDAGASWSSAATGRAQFTVSYDAEYTLGTLHGTMRTLVHGASVGVAFGGRR